MVMYAHLVDPEDTLVDRIYSDFYHRKHQRGYGMDDYFRVYRRDDQSGDGFGSFLRGLFRAIVPLAKPAVKSLAKHAFSTATGVLSDVAHGEDWRVAGKRRLGETGDKIIGQIDNKVQKLMTGSGA